jgi:hypothetical protein
MDEPFHRLFHGHDFADQRPVFVMEEFPGLIGIRVHEKRTLTLRYDLKHISLILLPLRIGSSKLQACFTVGAIG